MFGFRTLARKLFGSANDRMLSKLAPRVTAINTLEGDMNALSDEALRGKTQDFRDRLEAGETLDDLLVEAFAVVREAAHRALGMRPYDVQLIGGMVLHDRSIAEMKTGEGKTLVATLAVYLNALSGDGVHVITVNDYLAERDAQWMGQVYEFLGMSVGVIIPGKGDAERRAAYACDITYGTNNEFGFDYLRDNMKHHPDDMVQRAFNFAIVDEVDSILIDEARTPLIISGPSEDKSDLYEKVDAVVATLGEGDYELDEKAKTTTLTEDGNETLEAALKAANLMTGGDLYDYENIALVHHVDQALKAQHNFERDRDYIVKNGQVIIIDEFTGRMMEGRRYSGGLHQAIEAKERVPIQPENQTMASITFQNYFRMYPKLAGMTGTAATEAEEFAAIYGLGVIEIPTHQDVTRSDDHDEFYRTAPEKYNAIVTDIEQAQQKGQPVLVGTVSIEKSELLSDFLKKRKIKHQVLNARYHEQEAAIIAQAGRLGAVTIATNMAGRGTDIQLGGNADMRIEQELEGLTGSKREKEEQRIRAEVATEKEKVLEAGGLYVMGTERHESRRIDNQLRGRSGRQGDPGRSKFYLSLQDDLMRIFGAGMDKMLVRLGIEEGEAIVHPWINKAIENAQKKVEARNYDIRKNLVKFDDVMNDQRRVVYDQRREIMVAEDHSATIEDMRADVVAHMVDAHIPPKSFPETWDMAGLEQAASRVFGLDVPGKAWAEEEGIEARDIHARLDDLTKKSAAERYEQVSADVWAQIEKSVLLQVIDHEWKDHLQNLDHLRQGVSLRAYGQRDPLNEYKSEAFSLFEQMLYHTRERVTELLANLVIAPQPAPEDAADTLTRAGTRTGTRSGGLPLSGFGAPDPSELQTSHPASAPLIGGGIAPAVQPTSSADGMPSRSVAGGAGSGFDPNDVSTWGAVPRNAPCPCGSGKKFKHCHGRVDRPAVALMPAAAGQPTNPYVGVGRNEPCPCGSGKKFKHCHGSIAFR